MARDSLARVKQAFFDSPKVQKYLDKKTKKALTRIGAFVRRTAQFSMRSRKGYAPSGEPPYAHGEKLLRKHIYFSYDERSKSVVVGPIRLQSTADQHIPRVMEEGGLVARKTRSGKVSILHYRPHPYMKPALDKHSGMIAEMYR